MVFYSNQLKDHVYDNKTNIHYHDADDMYADLPEISELKPPKPFKSVPDFMSREPDFDFCRMCFDGERLYVFDWPAVENRHAKLLMNWYHPLPMYRYGDGPITWLRMWDRCQKYRSRGFTIDTNLPTDLRIVKLLQYNRRKQHRQQEMQLFCTLIRTDEELFDRIILPSIDTKENQAWRRSTALFKSQSDRRKKELEKEKVQETTRLLPRMHSKNQKKKTRATRLNRYVTRDLSLI